ncbi:MAG: caspase family protein, partial [Chitinophagia bacterium]|nr:caspase family protein [Chitinophagia bacterium]
IAQQQQQQRPVTAPVQQAMNAHALVIGNAAYPGSGRLENPVNDSRAMSAKLRSMGFKVTEVEDANRAKLVTALSQFSRSAESADLSVLFYSDHGVQMLGTNYIQFAGCRVRVN